MEITREEIKILIEALEELSEKLVDHPLTLKQMNIYEKLLKFRDGK